MKKLTLCLMLLICLLATSCFDELQMRENCHQTIYFKNNSSKTLYTYPASKYPDTSLSEAESTSEIYYGHYVVSPDSVNHFAFARRFCLEDDFKSGHFGLDTMMIFVFDLAVLENVPEDTIRAKYMVLQRYDLSLSDLQKLDWEVTYPPTPEMKDMKMYPPYKEQ